jgi:hypothetical protein
LLSGKIRQGEEGKGMETVKVNIQDTSIRSMEEETKIRITPETLRELRKHKALGEFRSYDDLIRYWMKACPVNAPPGEGVK